MKKGDEISEINHLLIVLNSHIEKLEQAYNRKEHEKFNILKKEILQMQKRIHSLIK